MRSVPSTQTVLFLAFSFQRFRVGNVMIYPDLVVARTEIKKMFDMDFLNVLTLFWFSTRERLVTCLLTNDVLSHFRIG